VEIKRAVLVPFTAESMFDLIEQAEHYPEFLPWCVGSTILERSDEWVAARIDFKYLGVRFGFQTRNAKRRPASMQVGLVEGPFRRFQVEWKLTPLGTMGCKVSFEMGYEISDGLLDKVAAKGVEMVSSSMLDAFVKRAGELGAGKTTLVRGLLEALGIAGPVRSPTYTLVESYPAGARRLHHLDWYRLTGAEDLEGVGFRELLAPGNWVIVEWPERAAAVAAQADLALRLAYAGTGRRLMAGARTPAGAAVLRRWREGNA